MKKISIIIGLLILLALPVVLAEAQCVPSYEDVYILCGNDDCKFGVEQEMTNITIILSSNLGDIKNTKVKVSLCKPNSDCTGSNELTRVTALTDSNGEIYLGDKSNAYSLDYVPTKGGDYALRVIVDPDGVAYEASRVFTVASTLDLILNCPAQGYIERDVKCTWNVYVAGTSPKQKVDATPTIKVIQGEDELPNTPTLSSVTFQTDITGSVDVSVNVEKEGYLGDTEIAQVPINNPVLGQTFFVDNKDFFTFTGVGVNTGTHQLKLNIDESGDPIAIQSVTGEIRTPSGQIIEMTFLEKQGDWVTTYNFDQAGQTYKLSGKVIFEDITKDDLLFEYNILTASGVTDKNKTTITFTIVGIVVGVLIIVVVLIILFKKGGRRRR